MQSQEIDPKLFSKVSDFVNKRMGLYFPENRERDLLRGLRSASETFGYKDINTCIEQLISIKWSTYEIQTLASYLTIGETYFYRHKEQLDFIFSSFISKKPPGSKIRIWSAACASGEEPYSFAILTQEFFKYGKLYEIEITGTDINPVFLEKGKNGIYTEHSFRSLPKSIKSRYFTEKSKNEYALCDSIRDMVSLNYLNLASNTYPSEFNNTDNVDIIFCRNVFIYFQQETINRVVSNFRNCLKEDGLLFVSPAETFMISKDIMCKNHSLKLTYFSKTPSKSKEKTIVPSKITLPENKIVTQNNTVIKKTALPQKADKVNSAVYSLDINYMNKLFATQKYNELLNEYSLIDINLIPKEDAINIYELMSKTYANTGNPEKALEFSGKLIEADKLKPSSYYQQGIILLELGELEKALKSLKKTLFFEQENIMALFMAGNIYRTQNDLDSSVKYFQRAYNSLKKENDDKTLDHTEGITVKGLKEIIGSLLKGFGIVPE